MLLVRLLIESTIFANNYFKVNTSYYLELFMKLSMCCHLVTRQMEKASLLFSFIGWVRLLESENPTFSVFCGY